MKACLLSILAFLLFFGASCTSKEVPETPPCLPNADDLLTRKQWYFSSLEENTVLYFDIDNQSKVTGYLLSERLPHSRSHFNGRFTSNKRIELNLESGGSFSGIVKYGHPSRYRTDTVLCIVGELHNNRKKQSLTLEFSPVELGSTNVFFAKENNKAKVNMLYPRFIDATSPAFAEKANHTLDSLSKMLFHRFGNLKEPLEYGSSFQIEYGDQNYLSITILSAEPLNAFDKDVGMVYPHQLVFDKKGQKLLKLGDIFDTSQKFFSTVFNKISSEQLTNDPSFDTGQLASSLELTTESFDNFSICCEGLKIILEPTIIARYPVDVIIPWPAIKEFMTKGYKF